jgi:GTPase SAR1 family protein
VCLHFGGTPFSVISAVNELDGQNSKYQHMPWFDSSARPPYFVSIDVLEHPMELVCVGEGGVGKTSLLALTTIVRGKFPVSFGPRLLDLQKVYVQIDPPYHGSSLDCERASDRQTRLKGDTTVQEPQETVALVLWDTPGQEEFDIIRPYSYDVASLMAICFSVVDRKCLSRSGSG